MKNYNLDELRQRQQQLAADKSANSKEMGEWSDEKKGQDPQGWQGLVDKDKKLDTDIASNKAELVAAEKETIKEAGKQLETSGVDKGQQATLGDQTNTFVEDAKSQGNSANIYHAGGQTAPEQQQTGNNLPGVGDAQQRAQQQAKGQLEGMGITAEQQQQTGDKSGPEQEHQSNNNLPGVGEAQQQAEKKPEDRGITADQKQNDSMEGGDDDRR